LPIRIYRLQAVSIAICLLHDLAQLVYGPGTGFFCPAALACLPFARLGKNNLGLAALYVGGFLCD
jgi:hypothetical protein